MAHTIQLYVTPQGWMCRNSDPAVRQLFGTDVLPTAFTARASADMVLAEIRKLNPDCQVSLLKAVENG